MLVLRNAPASPFGRKVVLSAHAAGLMDRIRVVPADTNDPDDSLRHENPLGKIPALILEDGTVLYDSRVIVEALDAMAGGGRLIPVGSGRIDALRRQALADGLMDAAVMQVYEARWRPEEARSARWLAHHADKLARGLTVAEAELLPEERFGEIGPIALAAALGYLDLRFEGRWRAGHPRIAAWLDRFAETVPAYAATRVVPA